VAVARAGPGAVLHCAAREMRLRARWPAAGSGRGNPLH
jgi:hypothetical protein